MQIEQNTVGRAHDKVCATCLGNWSKGVSTYHLKLYDRAGELIHSHPSCILSRVEDCEGPSIVESDVPVEGTSSR